MELQETKNFTEDQVLEQLLNDRETEKILDQAASDNSDFLGIGQRARARRQAKKELKYSLREKHGNKWWRPGNIFKYRKDYKQQKNEVVSKAVSDINRQLFEERQAKRETKQEARDTRSEEQRQADFEASLEEQKRIDEYARQKAEQEAKLMGQQNLGSEADDEKKKKAKKMYLFGGIAVVVVIIVAVVLFVVLKK